MSFPFVLFPRNFTFFKLFVNNKEVTEHTPLPQTSLYLPKFFKCLGGKKSCLLTSVVVVCIKLQV